VTRVLFVSNGHGEAAIGDRIAIELRAAAPQIEIDHLALVGDGLSDVMNDVGPRRRMPSGGLIAMANLRNIGRDVRSGLLRLTLAQYRYLRAARGRYAVAVAIGDVYALIMTLVARAPTVFVGTAKSVSVAPYGPFEERVLRRARERFVRDDATVRSLAKHGLDVRPAANVIVDLFATAEDAGADRAVEGFTPVLALFPGSREAAYADAVFLARVVRALARERRTLGGVLSISPGLDPERFAADARADGWEVRRYGDDDAIAFDLRLDERVVVRAWRGPLGAILGRVSMVLGQAGTANEAAAAAGLPVVAFDRERDRKAKWYRQRQRGLLGDALAVFPDDLDAAVAGVAALVDDAQRRAAMGRIGRERMGPPGAAARIAACVATLARAAS